MAPTIDAPAGLEGMVVAQTAVGDVRGHEGFFHYRGHPAPELATGHSVEEVWHLLHYGHLPDERALRVFSAATGALGQLSEPVLAALPTIAAAGSPMAALRTVMSLVGQDARSWLDLSEPERARDALRLVATTAVAAAAIHRVRHGLAPLPPDPSLNFAANYLRMVTGVSPAGPSVEAMTRYLILTIDHGFNASTFAARVVASTGADLTAAVVAGIGALSGPLHGGAPSRVLEMLTEIGSVDRAGPWVAQALAAGHRIMGFGHRVYRTEDPRSAVLKATALDLGGPLVDLAVEVERVVLHMLDAQYPQRDLRTNVEFYAGVVLHLIGVPAELFSPTFAVSRTIGWVAHILEQTRGNRLIRPSSRYVGSAVTQI